jgi:hypothetical protein
MAEFERAPFPFAADSSAFAPRAGIYEEVNVLGVPSGLRTKAWEGEQLPRSPRGYWWRLLPNEFGIKPDR